MQRTPPNLRSGVSLSALTTLGIGGPAEHFLAATRLEELEWGLDWADSRGLEVTVLGGGSNVVVSDEGVSGLVIRLELRGFRRDIGGRTVHLKVAAGESWDEVVSEAVGEGWAGIECLSGIPGSVGATPIQNVGAYGQEVSDVIETVEALDRRDGRYTTFSALECEFGYRSSRFKRAEPNPWVVVSVVFKLYPEGKATLRYPELRRVLAGSAASGSVTSESPALETVRNTVLELRRTKGMVLDPNDPDSRSDGSFFVNPVVSREVYRSLEARSGQGLAVPGFPFDSGVKVPAAWLIERAGFQKGYGQGAVGLSSKHTLAIVNRGGGTSDEVIRLMREIQRRVEDRFGLRLSPEPRFLGFSSNPAES